MGTIADKLSLLRSTKEAQKSFLSKEFPDLDFDNMPFKDYITLFINRIFTPNRPSGLIAQYKPYLNSNDSPTRDILKDYSGQGHDIQLYNFGYAGMSGYGGYKGMYKNWKQGLGTSVTRENDIYVINRNGSNNQIIGLGSRIKYTEELYNYKVRFIGFNDYKVTLNIPASDGTQDTITLFEENSGDDIIVQIPKSDIIQLNQDLNNYRFLLNKVDNIEKTFKIQFIPDYPGALVSDGVDDYGLCENFPILTKEKGYTICALVKPSADIAAGAYLLSKNPSNRQGEFSFMSKGSVDNAFGGLNYGQSIQSRIISDNFVYQKSNSFNGFAITKGSATQFNNELCLFRYRKDSGLFGKFALYTFEIYNRDLTDEEVENVREAMYEELLTATNALQNHIIADYECYDKTNEDEDRDVLKDLSGNGHDIQLYNFGFAESSGYGKYATNFSKFSNQDKDYNTATKDKITINYAKKGSVVFSYFAPVINCKIKITGVSEAIEKGEITKVQIYCKDDSTEERLVITVDGEYTINNPNASDTNNFYIFPVATQSTVGLTSPIVIEQIPEYQGALVSDGVDDYGLCNNFPILNKEDGYTILAIRKIPEEQFSKASSLIAKGTLLNFSESEFVFDFNYRTNAFGAVSFTHLNSNLIEAPEIFSYQTSKLYNGKSLTQSDLVPTESNKLGLFRYVAGYGGCGTYALYRAMILDKDCTIEEIKFFAKQMVAKHKEKTGETIELNF